MPIARSALPESAVLLHDRYRLESLLGSGGAADVHRATDTLLDRPVAVKVLRDGGVDEAGRARFTAEARTLAGLNHRNLVTVLDAGIAETQGRPFLVMELVEGQTLAALLAAGPLPREQAAQVAAEVADALAYAHDRGVVHRDVKPGNVLVGEAGRVKLADFGIARLLDDTAGHTRTGTTIGTAAYLSPEQVRGEQVTTAADVYALGLVLLETLTGRREYAGPATEAALARLHRSPEVPSDLPGGWRTLLTAMTATDAAERPTAAQVAELLRRDPGVQDAALATAVLTAPVGVADPAADPATDPATGPAAEPFADRAGRAIAASPGRVAERWRRATPEQRGVAGALAGLVLLIVVAAAAAGAGGAADPVRPGRDSPTGPSEGTTSGVDPASTNPASTDPTTGSTSVQPPDPGKDKPAKEPHGKAKGHDK